MYFRRPGSKDGNKQFSGMVKLYQKDSLINTHFLFFKAID